MQLTKLLLGTSVILLLFFSFSKSEKFIEDSGRLQHLRATRKTVNEDRSTSRQRSVRTEYDDRQRRFISERQSEERLFDKDRRSFTLERLDNSRRSRLINDGRPSERIINDNQLSERQTERRERILNDRRSSSFDENRRERNINRVQSRAIDSRKFDRRSRSLEQHRSDRRTIVEHRQYQDLNNKFRNNQHSKSLEQLRVKEDRNNAKQSYINQQRRLSSRLQTGTNRRTAPISHVSRNQQHDFSKFKQEPTRDTRSLNSIDFQENTNNRLQNIRGRQSLKIQGIRDGIPKEEIIRNSLDLSGQDVRREHLIRDASRHQNSRERNEKSRRLDSRRETSRSDRRSTENQLDERRLNERSAIRFEERRFSRSRSNVDERRVSNRLDERRFTLKNDNRRFSENGKRQSRNRLSSELSDQRNKNIQNRRYSDDRLAERRDRENNRRVAEHLSVDKRHFSGNERRTITSPSENRLSVRLPETRAQNTRGRMYSDNRSAERRATDENNRRVSKSLSEDENRRYKRITNSVIQNTRERQKKNTEETKHLEGSHQRRAAREAAREIPKYRTSKIQNRFKESQERSNSRRQQERQASSRIFYNKLDEQRDINNNIISFKHREFVWNNFDTSEFQKIPYEENALPGLQVYRNLVTAAKQDQAERHTSLTSIVTTVLVSLVIFQMIQQASNEKKFGLNPLGNIFRPIKEKIY